MLFILNDVINCDESENRLFKVKLSLLHGIIYAESQGMNTLLSKSGLRQRHIDVKMATMLARFLKKIILILFIVFDVKECTESKYRVFKLKMSLLHGFIDA